MTDLSAYRELNMVYNSGTEPWIKFTKIRDKDNDGVIEMFNNVNPYNDIDNYLEWKIIGGKFIKQ